MRVLKSRVAFHLQSPGFVFIFIFNVSTLFKRDRSSGENDRSDEGLSTINQIDLLYRPLRSVRFSFLIIDAGDHDAVPWKAAVSGVVNACDQSASSKQTPTHTHTHRCWDDCPVPPSAPPLQEFIGFSAESTRRQLRAPPPLVPADFPEGHWRRPEIKELYSGRSGAPQGRSGNMHRNRVGVAFGGKPLKAFWIENARDGSCMIHIPSKSSRLLCHI